jgi:hypothetical protein
MYDIWGGQKIPVICRGSAASRFKQRMHLYFQQFMALSAAERARKYRENRDKNPERRKRYLKYQQEKYQNDLKTGARKVVQTMTPREHREMKKIWRKQKQHLRQQAKDAQQNGTQLESPTGKSCSRFSFLTLSPPAVKTQ